MTIADAYDRSDATGLAELVARGEVTPTELLDEALSRVEARNPAVNAIIAVFEDRARAAIAAGLPDGPLRGVPFVLKDLGVDLEGTETSSGSRLFAGTTATVTSEIVRRYERAGLVIFGKTNTPEFGMNVSTEPVRWGPTRNPWDLDRSAGGSSGGAGAAVAAGIVPAAHATDGGGSIRIPASMNGLFGLKPTRGRTPIGPPAGEGWNGLSHGHVVTRTVRDSAALLDVAAGPSVGEPYSAPCQHGSFLEATGRSPGRLRVGFTLEARPGLPVDDECAAAVGHTVRLLAELGHEIEQVSLPVDWAALLPAMGAISGSHIGAAIDRRARELGREVGPDDVEGVARAVYALGRTRGAWDYVDAVATVHRVGREVGQFFETVDVVVTPTLATVAPRIGEMFADVEDLAAWGARAGRVSGFLGLANATGQPAMSLPLHTAADGMPIGVQVMGRFGAEALLLSLAAQLESAAPWADRRAPIR
jgi:amidase/6-aminohexanoate-cyclic-dimer hydrolase